ncbi:fasciclin domain-containing protein [Thalassiella azotivora]
MRTRLALTAVVASVALATAACSSEEEPTTGSQDTMAEETEGTDMGDEMSSDEEMTAAGPVGPGCEAYAEENPDGPGSIEGMSEATVTQAAAGNPLLTTLVSALSGGLNPDVDLTSTLDGGEFTVFAPVDDAFAQVDAATLETLKTDADLLTSVLTYHVVEGQKSPEEVTGTQTTVQGGTLEVAGEPEMLTVNGADVLCGGVQTANATVYLIDSVLMPMS